MSEDKGNIYQRLQRVRDELRALNLKRSGINTAKNFTFYEMEDFWPDASRLFAEQGLFTAVTFGTELAELVFINIDDPTDCITFTARVSTFKGLGSPCQDQGGADSYVKRRLYLNALELHEKDVVDATSGKRVKSDVMDRFQEEEKPEVEHVSETVTVAKPTKPGKK